LSEDRCAVVCRYHGFEWGADGRIKRIPALEAAQKSLPTGSNWRVGVYSTIVRYGLIWVCLEREARLPLLEVPEADNPEYQVLVRPPQVWRANCGRMVEASLDTYHFAFTHRASIGDPGYPDAPATAVTSNDDYYLIQYDIGQPDTPMINYGTDAVATARSETASIVTSHYDFYAVPSCIHMIKTTGDIRFATLFAMCPINPHLTTAFRILFAHRAWDVDHEHFQQVEDAIFAEDQLVVESQRPWELKTDLDAELHALMDRPTVGYRRWLKALGFEYS
jgi:phenylpropionate dioxygenase-like ring-hydroxylating dioxygenase large terminal subunit